MVLLGYGFGITDFLEELLTFSLATFPETFTLAGKVGQSTVQRPLNLCQAWFILVVVHWVDSNFEHYEILLRRNNVDILISCRSWDIISEKRPKSCVHCEKTILVISGPDRWPLCGHMRVRTVFDFFQIPRRYNNPKKASHDPWCSGWCWENPFEISPFTLYLETWLFSEEIYIVPILNLNPGHVCSIHFDQEESENIRNWIVQWTVSMFNII